MTESEARIVAILCTLTDELGYNDDNKVHRSAYKEALKEIMDLINQLTSH